MSKELNSMRVYALGLAHRAAADITRDSFRQLRNYVDLCAFLSHSEQSQYFFDLAQTVLEKTDSLYYPLIQRALASVSNDALCTVGVNLGVDGLIYGASELKKGVAQSDGPLYWATVAEAQDAEMPSRVMEGEAVGQYLWVLLCRVAAEVDAVLSLAQAHPKSDFFLMIAPELITEKMVTRLCAQENIVTMLTTDRPEISEAMHTAILLLKSQKAFYGLFAQLDDSTVDQALDREWLSVLAEHSLLCVYSEKAVRAERAEALNKEIYRMRTESGSPVVLLDWEKDSASIGSFIDPKISIEYRAHL